MSIERLLTVSNNLEAASIQNRLENAGIDSFVTNENFTTLMPHYYGMLGSGIQIMIEDSSEAKAKEVLAEYFPITREKEDCKCPKCDSTRIGYSFSHLKIRKIFVVLISFLTFVPFGNLQMSRHCKECRHEF